jgi:2-oxoisovalerate dehydrogenase E2 component (dihydrolipoyl transacylase)
VTVLPGSGPGGRVLKRDVLAALDRPDHGESVSAIVPWVTTVVEVDLSAVVAYREQYGPAEARRGAELSEPVFLALAVSGALLCYPLLNSTWDGDRIIVRRRVHLAFESVAGNPSVVCDAHELSLRGLARALGVLRRKTAQTAPCPPQANNATFRIAALDGAALWRNPPPPAAAPCAAASLGPTQLRAMVIDDRIVVRPLALLALTYDARVLDLPQADAFLADVRRRLEHLGAFAV